MAPVHTPAKVLVTGANGYLACWIVRMLLEHGYLVRGTVRTTAKGDTLERIFKEYSGRFEYIVVEDILKVSLRITLLLGADTSW